MGAERLASERPGPCSVTIGTFDGVHLGHRALIARAVEGASAAQIASAAVTWDRHPMATLRPDQAPALLTLPARRIELLRSTELDVVTILPFDDELSTWAPERFVTEVLVEGLGARSVYVGEGWRFGHKAAGDTELLTELGLRLGFEVHLVGLVEAAGGPVSSSRIRDLVAAGDMEQARVLLGRPFDVQGEVVHGDDRGASLGWPTANLGLDPTLVPPPRGVYAGRAELSDGLSYPAAVNVGVNPTFGGDPASTPIRLEAYLLDFEGDLYGQTIRIELWKRLRDEERFDSAGALTAQIAKDVDATRQLAG